MVHHCAMGGWHERVCSHRRCDVPLTDPKDSAIVTGMNLPTPTERRGNRTAKFNYPTGKSNDEGEIFAQLYCGHSADRKRFFASLKNVTLRNEGGFSVESFMLLSGVSIATLPVGRYSEKAFSAFIAEAKRALADRVAGEDIAVLAIMAGEGEGR